MHKVTVTLEEGHVDLLEDQEAESRSAALRDVLDEYRELLERVDELEDDLNQERARSDDLRKQLQKANAKDDRVDELARYVERERERERAREEADVLTRTQWWLFGRDVDAEG